jgi:broad specificity phosphatase PhoE
MRLILVRHGETQSNARQLQQGFRDHPLNERGREQVRLLARRLRRQRIDAAYTSDLQRAVHTLDAVLVHHPHLRPRRRRVLRERSYGVLEGRPLSEHARALEASGLPFHEFQPRRGESFVQVRRRLGSFIRELFRNHRRQTVLVVSHGGTMAVLLLHLFGMSWSELQRFRRHPNTGVTVLEFRRGTPKLRLFKDVQHLPKHLRPTA